VPPARFEDSQRPYDIDVCVGLGVARRGRYAHLRRVVAHYIGAELGKGTLDSYSVADIDVIED
jgi:hypothetical protein